MHYYDDILNVIAYLRSKQLNLAQIMNELIGRMKAHDEAADKLRKDMDDLKDQMVREAKNKGIDISDIDLTPPEQAEGEASDSPDDTLRIHISRDFDFQAHFETLLNEAHAAGFTDVHPEELLTQEETERAISAESVLDRTFEEQTALRGKDMIVLMIAVAVRVAIFYLSKYIHERAVGRLNIGDREAPPVPPPNTQGINYDTISATDGVDINHVINQGESLGFNTPSAFINAVSGLPTKTHLRRSESIFSEPLPFEYFSKNNLFSSQSVRIRRDELAGYDKYLGWVVGVLNIMTDTVTTKKFKSFAVDRRMSPVPQISTDINISTMRDVFLPAVSAARRQRESIVAAAIQEACVLDYAKLSPEQVKSVMSHAVNAERKGREFAHQASGVIHRLGGTVVSNIGTYLNNTFVNTLIYAIHAVMYREETDGDFDRYTIRTNKIVCYSNGLAAVANSIEGLVAQDWTKIDYGGMLMYLVSLFQSKKYWVEVKAAFLVSEHKKKLDSLMQEIDKYIVYDD